MSFWGELKRRNVFKVGATYVIVAWLIVQVANTFFPILNLPDWAVTLVACLLILGFPIALIHAWAYEVTPDGIKRTKEVPLAESITHLTGRKLNYILAGLLIVAVGYIIIDKVFVSQGPVENEMTSSEAEQETTAPEIEEELKTIAVLPFENLSSDPEQEYFVDGLSEEILNSLAKIPDLHVTSRTSSFYFKNTDTTIQNIANVLNVSHILEGSVRKAGNALRITAQLIRVADDRHLWSEIYDKELKDIFDLQEEIAIAVSNELKVKLGVGKSLKQLGGTENEKAYELYLVAKGLNTEREISSQSDLLAGDNRALKSLDAAIAIDPEFALAWAYKAFLHRNLNEIEASLRAAQMAIELEPNLADGYSTLGMIRTLRCEYIEAELAYRRAMELTTSTEITMQYGLEAHYQSVGNLQRAYEICEGILKKDPLFGWWRGYYILILGALGDMQRAEEEYDHGRALLGDKWFWGDFYITPIRLGKRKLLLPADIVYSDLIYDTAKDHLDSPEQGLAELRRLYADENNLRVGLLNGLSLCVAYFGDPDFAMDLMEQAVSIRGDILASLWLPVMKDVRQLPRFKEFVREIGLVDYWDQFGWPDICRPLGNGDFVCD